MFKKLHWGAIIIGLLVIIISIINFRQGTFLTGWDNLHPEFNPTLNISRSLSASWQEYQGLGLAGGMGHASDLPRQIFLWFSSLFFPLETLRYLYHFLMLALGPIGAYFLIKDYVFKTSKEKEFVGLVGGLFYLFNMATLQMFYAPFEPYSAHFAFLPWLFWANLKFWEEGKKKLLFALFLINLLAIPQGYVITFFFVYVLALSLLALFFLFRSRKIFQRVFLSFVLLFAINAFWFLPNLFFVFNKVDVNLTAKINQMATETNFLQNKKYGDFLDVALLKGFWFDIGQQSTNGEVSFLMGEWVNHLKNPINMTLGLSIFAASLFGLFLAFKNRIKTVLIFVPVFLLGFTVLANNTPLFSFLSEQFYKLPLFSQIFRFPFTKFSLLIALILALFYATTCGWLLERLKQRVFKFLVLLPFALFPFLFLLPIFQGQLFYEKHRLDIPKDYFQTFEFFNSQDPNTRIANFPQPSYWGWTTYRWDYQGSGLWWYGIKQPVMDRAFDVWGKENENYYWEISQAIYSRNLDQFEQILEKYQVNWLLVDHNVINLPSAKAVYLDEIEEMLSVSPKATLKAEFGRIKIYQVNLKTPVKNYVFLMENPVFVYPDYKWNNFDKAYSDLGDYVTKKDQGKAPDENSSYFYPFRSLFTGRTQQELEFEIREEGEYFVFSRKIPDEFRNYTLATPEVLDRELLFVNQSNFQETEALHPDVLTDGYRVEVRFPKVWGYYSAELDFFSEESAKTAQNCNELEKGTVKNEQVRDEEGGFIRLYAQNAHNCSASFWLPQLPHTQSYLIAAENRNLSGRSLLFWLENPNNRKANIETYLPKKSYSTTSYFVQPPMESDGFEYSLHFDNVSLGDTSVINDLGLITVNQIPYHFLMNLRFVPTNHIINTPQESPILEVKHPNSSLYEIRNFSGKAGSVLALSQAYQSGWEAYKTSKNFPSILAPILGQRIGEQVMVNNWSNGWKIKENIQAKENEKVVIFFLPQYLQYLGFILFFGSLVMVSIYWRRQTREN